jgi:predicted nucleotide-binding protein
MTTINVEGYWTGDMKGTNPGGLVLELKQDGGKVTGLAKMHEPAFGIYEYVVNGNASGGLSFQLIPQKGPNHVRLGTVRGLAKLIDQDTLEGRWKSDIGTEGIFKAKRSDSSNLVRDMPKSNSVFIVHGHDEGAKHSVARFIERLGVTPVILQEQINRGMTVIEKFEEFASRAGFAVVVITPDDVGYPVGQEEKKGTRARQNVILELGYFAALLGRSKTLVLTKGDVEMPSDILGLVYEPMDGNEGWKMRLARELKAAGFVVDLNKAIE